MRCVRARFLGRNLQMMTTGAEIGVERDPELLRTAADRREIIRIARQRGAVELNRRIARGCVAANYDDRMMQRVTGADGDCRVERVPARDERERSVDVVVTGRRIRDGVGAI